MAEKPPQKRELPPILKNEKDHNLLKIQEPPEKEQGDESLFDVFLLQDLARFFNLLNFRI